MSTETNQTAPQNEDLEFERKNVSTTSTQPYTDNEEMDDAPAVDESKVEELAANRVKPLSESEKQPKLEEDDRNEEMNRRTSIGD